MSTPPEFPPSFVRPWKELLLSRQREQLGDLPNHHVRDPECLITTSSPQTLYVGTGYSIFTRGIIPAILNAKSSVHFVTCYWAASPSLDAIKEALLDLAASRRGHGTARSPLKVTIGFSSWGLFQKLFHTSSRDGQLYPPSQWGKLGLPDQRTLASGGIQLTVKSLFFTPFSVMHPKYVIIDGCRAFVPSCNVSWERWFEGCVELEGDVVQTLMAFHQRVWGIAPDPSTAIDDGRGPRGSPLAQDGDTQTVDTANSETGFLPEDDASAIKSLKLTGNDNIPTILLPSSHHRNPRFSFFPFLSHSDPPMTPLNAALLTLIANARRQITILTPNVTSWPVLNSLLEALGRGVDVQIRTNQGMMLIEQLVTAGTTTSICLKKFVKRYNQLRANSQPSDIEAPPVSLGRLEILYYKPVARRRGREDEPVVSHFKMTKVDNEYLVLGSGNMDRASWWTSQELGFLFYVPGLDWHKLWDGILERRMEVFYRS
ncbi:IQ calmodulin-binding motif protein [Pochonia chlamydosporia 170]|uniref:IQ calmodulin-binding motif protein n=1 Tax=Pochonia chlamydosporia 170 TaxID=1380566 RepID=A0A179FM18_METCM|nr:IQ calmodulin-binding motif protein [Pochonia chlamydosporia 170]OAQ66251.1 IQ calmodulin-binding motif protein [Pochonia chlamydosporia 170]